jgi:peptidyl-prolyl cis-trans isomerase B (cyclophilin B)
MIQGGCPEGTGMGGPGYLLKQEFNDTPHERGILSMARSADPNSAGSQFFICVEPARFLDKQYTAFGKVTKGMDVVDRIVAKPTGRQDRPLEPVKIKSVTVKKKGEEAAESK